MKNHRHNIRRRWMSLTQCRVRRQVDEHQWNWCLGNRWHRGNHHDFEGVEYA